MFRLSRKLWFSISLQQKLLLFAGIVTVVLAVSAFFNVKLTQFSIDGFRAILSDNVRCGEFLEDMKAERAAFEELIRENSEEARNTYEEAAQHTQRSVSRLPYSYGAMGSRRYARTWSIKNAYESYTDLRDEVLSMNPESPEFVNKLYWVYDIQEYLELYGSRLIQETLNQGNESYEEKAGRFSPPCHRFLRPPLPPGYPDRW